MASEKSFVSLPEIEPLQIRQRQPHWRHTFLVAAAAILAYQCFFTFISTAAQKGPVLPSNPFKAGCTGKPSTQSAQFTDWAKISPAKDLEYVPCFQQNGNLSCSRLELPLDYFNGTHPNETVQIAVVRLAAKVPITDPRYGGAILVNPGGPGGSGTAMVIGGGSAIQSIVDSEENDERSHHDAKYYDIIGFDPRGISPSTPVADCFGSVAARMSWNMRVSGEGILGSSDAAVGRVLAMDNALGGACADTLKHGNPIMEYVTTAAVASDMIEIIEKHGKWREAEAKRLAESPLTIVETLSPAVWAGQERYQAHLQSLQYHEGKEKLQYWGFSYGTYLGTTFASMFPDRVGRVLLDGVVDAEDYSHTLWTNNMEDEEKTMQYFFDGCAKAGPTVCPLARKGSSSGDVRIRFQTIVTGLYHNPLPSHVERPEVLTYSDVKNLIRGVLYSPVYGFPVLAMLLAQIESGNIDALAPMLEMYHTIPCDTSQCPPCSNKSSMDYTSSSGYNVAPVSKLERLTWTPSEATFAILCGDGFPQTGHDVQFWDHYWRELEAISPTAGATWAAIRMMCSGWTVRPRFKYSGPFKADTSPSKILWIGNTADPATPLSAAKKMSTYFPGSILLQQDNPGHCSTSAYSPCTIWYIRTYFRTSQLPPPNIICPVWQLPFGQMPGNASVTAKAAGMWDGEEEVLNAQQLVDQQSIGKLREILQISTLGLGRMPMGWPGASERVKFKGM